MKPQFVIVKRPYSIHCWYFHIQAVVKFYAATCNNMVKHILTFCQVISRFILTNKLAKRHQTENNATKLHTKEWKDTRRWKHNTTNTFISPFSLICPCQSHYMFLIFLVFPFYYVFGVVRNRYGNTIAFQ